ncbi:hypothetical protein GTY88_28420 [Streptomyces sp. SID5926]|nr:hypothetical protein [Streptomyces sp. SID5926]
MTDAAGLVGLREPEEARSRMWGRDGVEMDLVTHDLRKVVRLTPHRNGYVLEQLRSPPVVAAKAEREHRGAGVDHARVCADVERLYGVLDEAQGASVHPGAPTAYDALHDFVVRTRLER